MTDRRRLFAVLYYGGLALVLALILLQLLDEVLGARLASHVAHNSEAYLAALVLSAWIQFVRPRLTGRRAEWPIAVLVGVIMLAIGVALVQTHLPSRFRTLNEAFIALAVLIPYVQARRPLSRVLSYGLPGVVLLLVLVVGDRGIVRDQAESAAMLILIPIGLDFIDRGILQSDAVTSVRAPLELVCGAGADPDRLRRPAQGRSRRWLGRQPDALLAARAGGLHRRVLHRGLLRGVPRLGRSPGQTCPPAIRSVTRRGPLERRRPEWSTLRPCTSLPVPTTPCGHC